MLNRVRKHFKQLAFVAKFIFKPTERILRVKNALWVTGIHPLKMADIDKFPENIDNNRKRTRLLQTLYR